MGHTNVVVYLDIAKRKTTLLHHYAFEHSLYHRCLPPIGIIWFGGMRLNAELLVSHP